MKIAITTSRSCVMLIALILVTLVEILVGEIFCVILIFVKLSNHKKYFDHKKWNYGIVFVYVVCAVPQYASACNRHKQFSALKLSWYMDTHVCVL